MSENSPLIPKGSLLEEQAKGRPHLRIALCIVAVHLIFLGGLLMQGCKREEPTDTASLEIPILDSTNFFNPDVLNLETNEVGLPAMSDPVTTPGAESATYGGNPYPGELPSDLGLVETIPPTAPEPAVPAGVQEYTVVSGDYFLKIARKFNVSVSDIARANPGVDSTKLQIGQKLTIPAASATPEPAVAGPAPASGTMIYTVKKGDTLTRIAANHGTTVPALKEMNGLVNDLILINQKLKVPAREP